MSDLIMQYFKRFWLWSNNQEIKSQTNEMKQFCRAIDKVTVKGSNQPVGFYTVDLDLANISPPSDKQ